VQPKSRAGRRDAAGRFLPTGLHAAPTRTSRSPEDFPPRQRRVWCSSRCIHRYLPRRTRQCATICPILITTTGRRCAISGGPTPHSTCGAESGFLFPVLSGFWRMDRSPGLRPFNDAGVFHPRTFVRRPVRDDFGRRAETARLSRDRVGPTDWRRESLKRRAVGLFLGAGGRAVS